MMATDKQHVPTGRQDPGNSGGTITVDATATAAGQPPAPGMIWIPGGTFLMGSDHHYPEEARAHQVSVDGFWIDQTTVTNRQFARFVAKTGHVTVAEQIPDPADYPGAKPEMLIPASTVFVAPAHPVDLRDPYNCQGSGRSGSGTVSVIVGGRSVGE
jgi:formylglycine-generating enzyme required for sulfatase activity